MNFEFNQIQLYKESQSQEDQNTETQKAIMKTNLAKIMETYIMGEDDARLWLKYSEDFDAVLREIDGHEEYMRK